MEAALATFVRQAGKAVGSPTGENEGGMTRRAHLGGVDQLGRRSCLGHHPKTDRFCRFGLHLHMALTVGGTTEAIGSLPTSARLSS